MSPVQGNEDVAALDGIGRSSKTSMQTFTICLYMCDQDQYANLHYLFVYDQ